MPATRTRPRIGAPVAAEPVRCACGVWSWSRAGAGRPPPQSPRWGDATWSGSAGPSGPTGQAGVPRRPARWAYSRGGIP
jgi:hypothetical protein